ncbi:MAG: ubiquinone biosynthesis protein UbiA [Desulfobacteraceae bacterium]|nr:MAG: ubiquinone biosynthesis protein UbiA [Desulfobacteraceae bacterium]
MLLLALSRTPHALLDMAAPGLAGLLLMDGFPPVQITLLGLFTVFAGYTSVYALNDLMDCRSDSARIKLAGYGRSESYLDSVIVRHPVARGFLDFREGLSWSAAWACLALAGAYALNPVCALIFLGGCLLEAVYCLLWRVSHFRALVSGIVKCSGPIAAAFALRPDPPIAFLAGLFLWLFCWEIGGQNIPADWSEIDDDRRLLARTIPVRLGPGTAGIVMLSLLIASVLFSLSLIWILPMENRTACALIFLFAGTFLLILPGVRLFRSRNPVDAMTLFNLSSLYPFVLLTALSAKILFT